MSEAKLIVAVDFGTTFSGVAFAYTDRPDSKVVISEWPGNQNATSDKVPTEIYYDSSAPNGFRWGFDIDPDKERHQWFKLRLDPSQNLSAGISRRYPSKTELPPSYDTDNLRLVTDYLTALREYSLQVMRDKLSSWVVDDTPIEYILTVPAVWSDRAKNSTIECARRAGMSTISCITEPEAAANYTIPNMSGQILTVGDHFVVCDAGGGTVDLITYKIAKLSPLQIEESVVGSGGLCGSTYLNRRFEEFLENKIGKAIMDNMEPWLKAKMIREFDSYIKRDFESSRNRYNMETSSVQRGFITITREEVREIFEPVISEVETLVRDQVREVEQNRGRVKAVLLVGGFGASTYLKSRLEKLHGVRSVIQPPDAWTAVVRGALHRELQKPIISHRQSRCHFGVKYWAKFRPGIDPESNKVWDSFEGEHKCNDLMRWYLGRGERVEDGKAVSRSWVGTRDLSHDLSTEDIDIYCCDTREAPDYKNFATKCTYKLRARVPRNKYVRKKSASAGHSDRYTLNYGLNMTTDSGMAIFRFIVDGVECGSMSTEYV